MSIGTLLVGAFLTFLIGLLCKFFEMGATWPDYKPTMPGVIWGYFSLFLLVLSAIFAFAIFNALSLLK